MRERHAPAHSAAQVRVPRTHIKVNERINCTKLSPDSTYVPWYMCSCTYIVQPYNNNNIKKRDKYLRFEKLTIHRDKLFFGSFDQRTVAKTDGLKERNMSREY